MAKNPSDPTSRIHMGAESTGTKVRVGGSSAGLAAAEAELIRQRDALLSGKMNGESPEKIRRRLIRTYYRGLMRASGPERSSVRGHRWASITCRVGGEIISVDWEYLPGPGGKPMVLAFCPECYWIAPKSASTADATRPVFVQEQLGRIPGNPESDKKFVAFQIQATSPSEIYFSDKGICIDRLITCPQSRVCGWTVKVTDGIASRQPRRSTRIVRPNESSPLSGPLIVKAKL